MYTVIYTVGNKKQFTNLFGTVPIIEHPAFCQCLLRWSAIACLISLRNLSSLQIDLVLSHSLPTLTRGCLVFGVNAWRLVPPPVSV